MVVAIAIVGAFAILFSLVQTFLTLCFDDDGGLAGLAVLALLFLIATFVLAVIPVTNTIMTVSIVVVGAFAILGAILNLFFSILCGDVADAMVPFVLLGIFGFLLSVSTFVLAVCK